MSCVGSLGKVRDVKINKMSELYGVLVGKRYYERKLVYMFVDVVGIIYWHYRVIDFFSYW